MSCRLCHFVCCSICICVQVFVLMIDLIIQIIYLLSTLVGPRGDPSKLSFGVHGNYEIFCMLSYFPILFADALGARPPPQNHRSSPLLDLTHSTC